MIITTTFDTMTKKLGVDMGGKKLENVSAVHIFNFGSGAEIEVMTRDQDTDDGTQTFTRVVASEETVIENKQNNPLPSCFLAGRI